MMLFLSRRLIFAHMYVIIKCFHKCYIYILQVHIKLTADTMSLQVFLILIPAILETYRHLHIIEERTLAIEQALGI